VESFVIGYYNALGSHSTLHARIVIATSNSGNTVTAAHGQAWAQLVDSVAAWVISQGYAGQVDIAGGTNIEPGFNAFSLAKNWVDGYASVSPQRFLYNLGAAEGCPQSGSGSCNNGWTQDNLWYVSWGADPAEPLPEIYNMANAAQWAALSLYAYQNYGQSMIISGALTEFGACVQDPTDPTCLPVATTPAQGWQLLYNKLNSSTLTSQTLPWSTDIKWLRSAKDIQ
jgi:hypothetical protein